jgi:hypothetical protein
MLKDMSDQELKALIRELARGADLELTDERIDIVLPQFKQQLAWLETLQSFRLPLEAEPSMVFRHRRRASKKKSRPR